MALLEMNNRTPRVGPRCVQNARVRESALDRSVRHRLLPKEENASSPQDAQHKINAPLGLMCTVGAKQE